MTSAAVETASVDITVGTGCGQAPFLGSAFVFPARIEAEDYDAGGENVAYHDTDAGNNGSQYRSDDVDIEECTDTGGGYNVGWLNQSEWLEYTVTVPARRRLRDRSKRVASLSSGGTFHVEFNGIDETGEVIVPVTTGWQTWTTVSVTSTLTAGTQTMRFVPTAEGFNVNYFEVLWVSTGATPGARTPGVILHPCYPNPFNPVTTISYDLQVPATVNLAIYDVAGKLVQKLVSAESTPAGHHEIAWKGRDQAGLVVAAGVYFYRLDADGYSETKKMILAR